MTFLSLREERMGSLREERVKLPKTGWGAWVSFTTYEAFHSVM